MAASCSRLRASAQAFVPGRRHYVAAPVEPGPLVTYVAPHPGALPPVGFVAPPFSLGPAPPPLPQTGFSVPLPGCFGFPPGPDMGMHWAPPPMPHGAAAFQAPPPEGLHGAPPQPQQAGDTTAPQQGGHPPRAAGTTRRAAGARPRPRLDVPPRKQRALGPAPPASSRRGTVSAGQGGGDAATKGEPGTEPSPRSVLVTTTSPSPPVSPTTSLPATFPLPYVKSTTPPLPPHQASRGNARHRQMPRRKFNPASSLTSLMIRNIPNSFSRKRLMNILDQHCAEENEKIRSAGGHDLSGYDFLYLPIDFVTKANKGYAFVNVTSPAAARRLWVHLHGYRWQVKDCSKICQIDNATIQGRDALVAHFSGSCFDCETEEYLPVRFQPPRDGARPSVAVQHVVGRLGHRS